MVRMIWRTIIVLALLVLVAPALAETRVALVVGNGAYASARMVLPNPPADAKLVAALLERVGFSVDLVVDGSREQMYEALDRFAGKAETADIALFYFAGHGIQDLGQNYLMPVDAELKRQRDLRDRFVPLDDVLQSLSQARGAKILMLDACRDNEAVEALRAAVPRSRSAAVSRGLAPLPKVAGMLVAFATQPGVVAADGTAFNSPFTEALARHLAQPGLELRQMLTRVRVDVAKATDHKQIPEVSDSLLGEVFLNLSSESGSGERPAVPLLPPPPSRVQQQVAPQTPTAAPRPLDVARVAPSTSAAPLAQGALGQPQAAAVAQRAILYEESGEPQGGTSLEGTVTWRTESGSGGRGQPLATALRGEVTIPGRNMRVVLMFRRNGDPTLPASHTIEVQFSLPANFANASIANVPGLIMKAGEQSQGAALAGLSVRVTGGFFLIGLSILDSERVANEQLLRDRDWIDIPILYANGRRAVLTLEKGTPGEKAFNDALAAWRAAGSNFSASGRPPQ